MCTMNTFYNNKTAKHKVENSAQTTFRSSLISILLIEWAQSPRVFVNANPVSKKNTQHNVIQYNDTQHNDTQLNNIQLNNE